MKNKIRTLFLAFASLILLCSSVKASNSEKRMKLDFFLIDSDSIVITDPGMELSSIKKLCPNWIINKCASGKWLVEFKQKTPKELGFPIPDKIRLLHENVISKEINNWKFAIKDVSGDTGMIGVYDFKHYEDDSVVKLMFPSGIHNPASASELWYSMNCRALEPLKASSVVPYGFVFSWDGGVDVYMSTDSKGNVNAIEIRNKFAEP
jgi:hypothetical protein